LISVAHSAPWAAGRGKVSTQLGSLIPPPLRCLQEVSTVEITAVEKAKQVNGQHTKLLNEVWRWTLEAPSGAFRNGVAGPGWGGGGWRGWDGFGECALDRDFSQGARTVQRRLHHSFPPLTYSLPPAAPWVLDSSENTLWYNLPSPNMPLAHPLLNYTTASLAYLANLGVTTVSQMANLTDEEARGSRCALVPHRRARVRAPAWEGCIGAAHPAQGLLHFRPSRSPWRQQRPTPIPNRVTNPHPRPHPPVPPLRPPPHHRGRLSR
jgi:hypothetical protein